MPQMDTAVRIRVPADMLLALDITTSNGKINLSGLGGMGSIRLRSSNGAIYLTQTRCKQLSIHTSNALITMDQVSGMDAVSARSSNGRIQANSVSSRGVIDLRTSNARINAENCAGEHLLYLQTSNGHVETMGCHFPSLQLKTSNGGISGTLPGSMSDYSLDCRTSNGFCNLPKFQPGGSKTLLAHTSNGSINISFENQ